MSSDLKVTNIKHENSSSNNLVLASDGDISVTNNLNVGTIKDATGNTTAMQINSNGHVTRNVIPSWCLGLASGQGITDTDLNDVNFEDTSDTNIFINNGCSVSSGVVTVSTAGLYYVGANLRIDSVGSGYVRVFVAKNNNVTSGEVAYILVGGPDSNYDTLAGSMIYQVTESDITSGANNFRVVVDTSTDASYTIAATSTFFGYLVG